MNKNFLIMNSWKKSFKNNNLLLFFLIFVGFPRVYRVLRLFGTYVHKYPRVNPKFVKLNLIYFARMALE